MEETGLSEEEVGGYILRISREEWVRQVFEKRKYYPGIMRRWTRGMTILLARKTEEGDSFIGYGIIGRIDMPWELPEEEQEYCKEHGWKCAISFKTLVRFERPLPLKKTFLQGDRRKGRFLHGIPLTVEQVDSIIEAAEDYQEVDDQG
ncbi:hypothetical protein CW700_07625 [Candidatus Bathyarchaeota archaeon]|nr:MAG: hypothetical protein CW700_07625 [Candidatus Bathyarchaeota archaeon]